MKGGDVMKSLMKELLTNKSIRNNKAKSEKKIIAESAFHPWS